MEQRNGFGQPVGVEVPGWTARPVPPRTPMQGRYCRVEPMDPARHAEQLVEAFREDDGRMWTYMAYGPFASAAEYTAWVSRYLAGDDPMFHTISDDSGQAVGAAAYLHLDPANGVIEVGHLAFSPRLQRTRAATEAMYLMMRRAFDELGYRRYEWRCHSMNAGSRRAAQRYGFTFEGVFRQAGVIKGRNRDTAWFSILDSEWPTIRAGFERWLDPSNFDAKGQQHRDLAALRE